MTTSEQTTPAIRMRYSKDTGEFSVLVTQDVELTLARELRDAGVLPLYQLRETAALAEVVLLTIGGLSSAITIADAIRRALGSTPGKRIVIKLDGGEIDASNYSARELAKIIKRMKE